MPTAASPLAWLLEPAGAIRSPRLALPVIALLALSAALVVVAALAMPAGYDWRLHSISESAAQGQQHGWIARAAFLAFGTAVLLLSSAMRAYWARGCTALQRVFGTFMIGAAAFSHAPWQAGVAADLFEDLLHSVCASGMGLAFCAAVALRWVQRGPRGGAGRALDALALFASVALPLWLASGVPMGGAAQRTMFALAYLWFGHEALIALHPSGIAAPPARNG